MGIELLGKYELELSAMQLIHNGGWAPYLAIREFSTNAEAKHVVLPYQRVADDEIFPSETTAIAEARRVAMSLLATEQLTNLLPRIQTPAQA